MTVRTVIAAVLAAYASFLTLRHNMHMFQLNGYKNDEHIRWIGKNLRQQWLLYYGLVLGILRIIFPVILLDILIYIALILDILVYRALRRLNNKKKLVYTARVKRMIVTIVLIMAAVCALVWIFAGAGYLTGVLAILVSSQFFMNLAANIINHPLEKAIGKLYINDAKKKLAGASGLKVIGVTGSFGKTSMKFFLQTLLQSRYDVLVTPGNFNTPMGITITVRNYLKPSHEIFICEMGARRVGEIKEVCDIAHPDYGIITSVGPQHLETFHSIENIQKTKFELADALPPDGMLFLNGDNELIRDKARDYDRKIFYCTEGSANETIGCAGYYARNISVSQFGTDFDVITPQGESESFQMRLIGAHNVINVTGAIAVAHSLGMSLKELKIPVRRLQPVEHRMQMREHGLVTIIDDAYNSNPVGSKAAVETLAMFDGIRILITPGMVELGEKEEEYNYKFGTYAAECCDHILLVGKKHTEPIMRGILEKGFPKDRCMAFDRLEEAVAYAYAIKGQGHKYILLENDLPDNY
ncbi:MAG: UDP-N-acetylmuramoyl-tripeptide--D-alanyl-D-alanine ligase [Lachnospiraceae bacterium]|nr:UDP-N-acetylmuramoyl-tripeptide--D-alanyl-D-alanine ligase [Lachnospiraceae bacterium]